MGEVENRSTKSHRKDSTHLGTVTVSTQPLWVSYVHDPGAEKVLPANVISTDYHKAFSLQPHNKMKGLFIEPRGFRRSFLNTHIA